MSECSLGDELTRGGGSAAGLDTVIDDIEIVDLEGRYTTERKLGHGGFGEVLLAIDTRLDRRVAIKRILGDAAHSKTAMLRFLTEAKAIAAIDHPNIIQIYDYGRAKDGPFLIMEYMDGGSLAERCKEGGLPLEEAVDLACQLCEGLAKAHDAGIIHRDIKPANVLLKRDGLPKLSDFGLAKARTADHGMTMTGAVMGTPDFMPPEQRRDASEVDHRSDLWSLAATIYQMVTGRSPKVIRFNDVPAALQDVLAKALEDRKESRYQSARDLKEALRVAGGDTPSSAVSLQLPTTEDVQEGRCHVCGTINSDINRKYCRKCGGQLRVPCLKCEAQTPVWDVICGECGTNQPRLLAEARSSLAMKRTQAENLYAAGSYAEAITAAQEVAAAAHPLLADMANWGVSFARDATVELLRQQTFASQQFVEAQKYAAANDDAAAIAAIATVPEVMRDVAARELLARCVARQGELRNLIENVRSRVAADDLDGLLPSVARILELHGGSDEFTRLHRQLVSRRDVRLTNAKDALRQDDLVKASTVLTSACMEDFNDEDGPLVGQVLACDSIAAALTDAMQAERRGDFLAAASALEAIPEQLRGVIVPGRNDDVAAFLEVMRCHVRRETQRRERLARHAVRRQQLADLRAEAETRSREVVEACAEAGFAAEAARCVFETTAGPLVVVIQRSWSPAWTLWFASAVKAEAFEAAAIQADSDERHDKGLLERGGHENAFRVVPDDVAPTAPALVKSPVKNRLRQVREHSFLLAIDLPSTPRPVPALVFNAPPDQWSTAIGWIDQEASSDALATFLSPGDHRFELLGVVKAARVAAPPECWDLTPRLQQGLDLAKQCRWDESVAALQAVVAEKREDEQAWVGIGVGLKQLGRLEEGVEAMTQAVAAIPASSLLRYNLACYHALAGHAGHAVDCLTRAIAMRPEWQASAKKDPDFTSLRSHRGFLSVVNDREPARHFQAELKRGLALAERDRFEEAVRALGGITERHPHVVEAWVALGRCLKQLNRPGDAAEAMERGLKILRRHPRLHYNLACYHSLAGRGTSALRALITAISLHPDYAEAAEKDRDLEPVRSDPRFHFIV